MRESGKSDTSRREFLKNIGLVAAGGLSAGVILSSSGCSGLTGDPGADVYADNGTFNDSLTLNGSTITTWPVMTPKITVGIVEPPTPSVGDLWVDTN